MRNGLRIFGAVAAAGWLVLGGLALGAGITGLGFGFLALGVAYLIVAVLS